MNNSIPLILASKSKPRRDVLFSAGICPTIRVSNVDEPAALERVRQDLAAEIDFYRFSQYLFFHQWQQLRRRANG